MTGARCPNGSRADACVPELLTWVHRHPRSEDPHRMTDVAKGIPPENVGAH
jgi:hypothetical protein